MSGICGIWNLNGAPVQTSLLERISNTMSHRGPDGVGTRVQGMIGMSCQHLEVTAESIGETQPVVNSAGTMLVFDGRLDNRDELLRRLEPDERNTDRISDARLVLALYWCFGDTLVDMLCGDFAFAIYDARQQHLLLARDALGIRPLYYFRANDLLVFASEVKSILAHVLVSAEPDDDVLAAFLMGGECEDCLESTLYRDVFSIPPSHLVTFTSKKQSSRCYFDFDADRQTRLSSFSDYAEAFHHYFDQAVRRRLRSAFPVAVSLSGGLDSSAIYCVAENMKRLEPGRIPPIHPVSYGTVDGSMADEQVFLNAIQASLGIEIPRLPLKAGGFFDACKHNTWHVESPLLDGLWICPDKVPTHVKQTGAKLVLTGHWGDQMLSGTNYMLDLFHQFKWGQLRNHVKEYPRWMLDADPAYFGWQAFIKDFMQYHLPDRFMVMLRAVRNRLNRVRGESQCYTRRFSARARCYSPRATFRMPASTSVHFQSLYSESRSGYHVHCMEWNNKMGSMDGLEMAFPFLDRDLISFLMSIPGEVVMHEGVPRAILRKALRGVVPEFVLKRRDKGDFTHIVNENMQKDLPRILACLGPDCQSVISGYLDTEALLEKRKGFEGKLGRSKDAVAATELEKLLGLEMWLLSMFGNSELS